MKKGFSVIEVILSVAIVAIVSVTLLPTIGWLVTKTAQSKNAQEASILLQEGVEVAYNVLQTAWDVSAGDYYPAVAVNDTGKSVWTLVSGSEDILQAKFWRQIQVRAICRDAQTGQEDTPGCETDENSLRIIGTVKWTESGKDKYVESQLLVADLTPL